MFYYIYLKKIEIKTYSIKYLINPTKYMKVIKKQSY